MPSLNGHNSNGVSSNGHHKEPPAKGALGVGPGVRSSLRLLQTMVNRGQRILDEDFDAMLTFAKSVRDDENASDRDRLRANELIATLASRAADKAVDLDKIERLDGGKPTERHDVTVQQREAVRRVLSDPTAQRAASALARRIAEQMEADDE